MSVLIGYRDNSGIWIGTDSLMTNGDLWEDVGPKYRTKNGITVGFVGYMAYVDWIMKSGDFPKTPLTASKVGVIGKALIETIKKYRDLSPELKDDMVYPTFVISDGKKLFCFSLGAGIQEIKRRKYCVEGSGYEVAAGAIQAAQTLGENDGETIVKTAIKAVIDTVLTCGGKMHVVRCGKCR